MARYAIRIYSGRGRLKPGRFYATEGGSIVFIQNVRDMAFGFYLDGKVADQWYPDGRYSRLTTTEEDINNEVSHHEIKKRFPNWYSEFRIPR